MYYCQNKIQFYYPNGRIAVRLNPSICENVLYVVYDGALRQCKVISSRIDVRREYSISSCDLNQWIKLDIAGVGVKEVCFTSGNIHDLGKRKYASDAEFFETIEDFKARKHCNDKMFYVEDTWEFAEAIFGDGVEFHYKEGKGLSCGSVAPATRYRWNGTRAEPFNVTIPNTLTFTPDSGIDFGSSKELINDLIYNTYSCKEDCEVDNKVQVVLFKESTETTDKVSEIEELKSQLKEWLEEHKVSLKQLQELIN